MLNLTIENSIGETKGTNLERAVKQNFNGEVNEAGIYLAMARLAQRQGYPEIAEVLKTIAWEEAEHASVFAIVSSYCRKIFLNFPIFYEKCIVACFTNFFYKLFVFGVTKLSYNILFYYSL